MIELRELQQWFAHVVEHPTSVEAALRGKKAQRHLELVEPNARMSAVDMLQVYRGGYLNRLVDVLYSDHGALQYALGGEAFFDLMSRYLRRFPSRHANLNRLGRELPAFVKRQRTLPNGKFLAELASVELARAIAFDADEFEPMAADAMASIPGEQWPEARFEINPSLQLLQLRFPVHDFYESWERDEQPGIPSRNGSWLMVFRSNDRVLQKPMTRSSFAVLSALVAGESLGEALANAREGEPVGEWFQSFAADGLFTSVAVS